MSGTDLIEMNERRYWLGSSDAAAIMGAGAYGKTALNVFLQKIGKLPKQIADEWKEELDFRKDLEGPIIKKLRRKFDYEIVNVNVRYDDSEYSFIKAEIDFEWRDPETGLIENGEIKTVSPFAFGENQGWGEEWTDEIPIHYGFQTQQGIMVRGTCKCVVAAMIGFEFRFYLVPRDDDVIAGMRPKLVHFWNENVLKQIPPEAVNMEDLLLLYRKHSGTPVEATKEIAEAVRQLRQVKSALAAHEGDKNDLQFKICKYICDAFGRQVEDPPEDDTILTYDGSPLLTWKKQSTTRLEAAKVRNNYPDVFSACSDTSVSRVMRLKKVK